MASEASLGGITSDEIRELAEDIGSPPTDAGASLTTRFTRRISDLIVARVTQGELAEFSVFLRSESLQQDVRRCDHIEYPLLPNGQDPVSGRVWLSTANFGCAYAVQLVWKDAASLFQAVRDVGFGEMAALLIDWRGTRPAGRLYRRGLAHADDVEAVVFEEAPISREEMKEVLDRFYERSLRTPALVVEGHGDRIWRDASRGIPTPRPEEAIQGRLLDVLKSTFSRHNSRAEPVTDDGRADIIIHRTVLSQSGLPATMYEWVLELKALCTKTTTGNNVPSARLSGAVRSGIEQVIAYKTQLSALNAALCCYDMQKSDSGDEACFQHIVSTAAINGILLWRWYLFRETAVSRRARGYLTSGGT